MTEEERTAFVLERKRLADFIAAHPSRFYVCEGCDAILDGFSGISVCPRCEGYRFSHDPERLRSQLATVLNLPPEELVGYE
jgi:hypothetical protein